MLITAGKNARTDSTSIIVGVSFLFRHRIVNMSAASDFGVFLWLVLTTLPIAVALQQFYYFKTQRRYTLQPVYGSQYDPTIDVRKIRYACLALQFLQFGLMLAALALNLWSYLGVKGDADSMNLGLLTYSRTRSWRATPVGPFTLTCDLEYLSNWLPPGVVTRITGTQCFAVVGGSVTVFVFSLVSLFLSLYQLAVLQPFLKWNYFVDPQPGQDLASAMSGGLWVRTLLFLILHWVMTFMFGVITCAIGSAAPGPSYFLLCALTVLTPCQSFLVYRYIQHFPPARSKIPPEVELMEPTDIILAIDSTEETVAAAVALAAAATTSIEKLQFCIQLREEQRQMAAANVAADGNHNDDLVSAALKIHQSDIRTMHAASAILQAVIEAATAATVAAKAGMQTLKPLMANGQVYDGKQGRIDGGDVPVSPADPNSSRSLEPGPGQGPNPIPSSAAAASIPAPDLPPRPRPLMAIASPTPSASASASVSMSVSPSSSASSSSLSSRRLLPAVNRKPGSLSPLALTRAGNSSGSSAVSSQDQNNHANISIIDPFQIQPFFLRDGSELGPGIIQNNSSAAAQSHELALLTRYGQQVAPGYHPPQPSVNKLDPAEAALLLSLANAHPNPVTIVPSSVRPSSRQIRRLRTSVIDEDEDVAVFARAPLDSSIVLHVDATEVGSSSSIRSNEPHRGRRIFQPKPIVDEQVEDEDAFDILAGDIQAHGHRYAHERLQSPSNSKTLKEFF